VRLIPITPTGKGPADRFSGDVYVTAISSPSAPSYLSAAIVHFTPGARTNWHVHPTARPSTSLKGWLSSGLAMAPSSAREQAKPSRARLG
jgi:quercetin dioxygenase-like cupin family protein